MPIDFAELINRTPEQRAAAQAESMRRFEESQKVLLQQRMADLAAAEALESGDRRTREFVEDMRRRAGRNDCVGVTGGLLLTLTDPQARWLRGLADQARALGKAPQLPEVSTTACEEQGDAAPAPRG